MKRTIFSLMVGAIAVFTLSSCLQNEEPAGVENLRNAKSELIKAEAQYKVAQIALIEADKALKDALIEGQNLDNKAKEIANKLAELDLELKQAQVEYEKSKLELQKAQDAAASEAEIARLRGELARYQAEVLRQENEQLRLQNEKELLVEYHKEALLKAQKAIAEAEKAYKDVLEQINSASKDLTPEEKALIEEYTAKVETYRESLKTAQNTLIAAQHALVNAKYEYDAEGRRIELTGMVEAAKESLEAVKELLEEAKMLDLTGGTTDWMTQKAEIEEKIKALESQKEDVKLRAEQKRQEKTDLQLQQTELQKRLGEIDQEMNDLYIEYTELYEERSDERFTIPEQLRPYVENSLNDIIQYYNAIRAPFSYYYDADDIVWNATLTSYYLSSQNSNNHIVFLGTLLGLPQYVDSYYDGRDALSMRSIIQNYLGYTPTFINDYIYESVKLQEQQAIIQEKEAEFNSETGYKAQYQKYAKMYETSMKAYLEAAESYGIKYNHELRRYDYIPGSNAKDLAIQALDDLYALSVEEVPSDALLTKVLAAFTKEQSLRDKMSGAIWTRQDVTDPNKTLNYKDLTLANYKAGIVGIYDLSDILTQIYNYPVLDYENMPAFYDYDEYDQSKWTLAHQWSVSSETAYALNFTRTPLTEADTEQIYIKYIYSVDYIDHFYYFPESSDLFKKLSHLYNASTSQQLYYNLRYSLWFQAFRAEKELETAKNLLANQELLKTFSAELTEQYKGFEARVAQLEEKAVVLIEKQLQLNEELKNIHAQYIDNNDKITKIEKEADAMDDTSLTWSEISLLDKEISDLTRFKRTLDDLIQGEGHKVTIPAYGTYPGVTLSPEDETLADEYKKYLDALEKDIEIKSEDLRKAENDLKRFEAGEDSEAEAVKEAEIALEQAQEEYDYYLELFNTYNELLRDVLAAITGGGEMPDAPAA